MDGPSRQELERAFRAVGPRAGPGVDGVSGARFSRALEQECDRLAEEVRSGRYTPRPLLHRCRPKADGRVRRLGIPCVRDRVLQRAVVERLTPRVERLLLEGVHGYRRGRSPATAVRHVCATCPPLSGGAVVHADVQELFDRLGHMAVRRGVAQVGSSGWLVGLVERWLDAWPTAPGRGVPQGAPLSPMLANLALDQLIDQRLEAGVRGGRPRVCAWVRYGDDLVAITPDGGPGLVLALAAWLRVGGLALAPGKVTCLPLRRGPWPRRLLGCGVRWRATARGLVLEPGAW